MGTHPIFESDFDCLTDNEIMSEELKIDTINKQQAPVELYERGVKLLNDLGDWVRDTTEENWQDKFLILEFVIFGILIIITGLIWSRSKTALARFIDYANKEKQE